MSDLNSVLTSQTAGGALPGAVALVARGDSVEAAAVGTLDVEGTAAMARDSLFRIASVTKPITAAAVMILVDAGLIGLDDPVGPWLPEIAAPTVVRTPESPVDDVVPAARAITVRDLQTFRAGYGFGPDFSLPALQPLLQLHRNVHAPALAGPPDEWMKELAAIPMLRQPGEAWLYNTCSEILGVLVERVSGIPFADFLAQRVFGPLEMADTGFFVPPARLHRLATMYHPDGAGGLNRDEVAVQTWSVPPAFSSGAGGLVSTVDDLLAFGQMLLRGGTTAAGDRILSEASVRLMMTDTLTPEQRQDSALFLEGKGWGFGGSVDLDPAAAGPGSVPGRYGWVGGSGTSWHVTPATGTVGVLLTQVAMTSPTAPEVMRVFWRYTAEG
jgi:CubicO group peptidase (beta-lactamase class C family)